MTPVEKYTWMRNAGFTHVEAEKFINKGVVPVANTELKKTALKRLQQKQGVK